MGNSHHRLIHLNSLFPIRAVWRGYGSFRRWGLAGETRSPRVDFEGFVALPHILFHISFLWGYNDEMNRSAFYLQLKTVFSPTLGLSKLLASEAIINSFSLSLLLVMVFYPSNRKVIRHATFNDTYTSISNTHLRIMMWLYFRENQLKVGQTKPIRLWLP